MDVAKEDKARTFCQQQGWVFDGMEEDGEAFGYTMPDAEHVGRQVYRLDQIPAWPSRVDPITG